MIIWTPAKESQFFVGMDIAYEPYSFPIDYTEEEEREATINLFSQLLEARE